MSNIKYLNGDATEPQAEGIKILAHLCNNLGFMGAGIAKTIRIKYPLAYSRYVDHSKSYGLDLGFVQLILVQDGLYVANMVAQNGINDGKMGWHGDLVDYDGLSECLKTAFAFAKVHGATVHMPRIGCGLAGSEWGKIEPILIKIVRFYGVDCYVYDFGV